MFLLIFNEGNVISSGKSTNVFLRQMLFIEIKILSSCIKESLDSLKNALKSILH